MSTLCPLVAGRRAASGHFGGPRAPGQLGTWPGESRAGSRGPWAPRRGSGRGAGLRHQVAHRGPSPASPRGFSPWGWGAVPARGAVPTLASLGCRGGHAEGLSDLATALLRPGLPRTQMPPRVGQRFGCRALRLVAAGRGTVAGTRGRLPQLRRDPLPRGPGARAPGPSQQGTGGAAAETPRAGVRVWGRRPAGRLAGARGPHRAPLRPRGAGRRSGGSACWGTVRGTSPQCRGRGTGARSPHPRGPHRCAPAEPACATVPRGARGRVLRGGLEPRGAGPVPRLSAGEALAVTRWRPRTLQRPLLSLQNPSRPGPRAGRVLGPRPQGWGLHPSVRDPERPGPGKGHGAERRRSSRWEPPRAGHVLCPHRPLSSSPPTWPPPTPPGRRRP